MIPCNGIHILPARSEPVAQATRARAGERRLSRRRGDATHGERRTTALVDPAREAPPGDHGGAMATTGSHRAQPFGGRDRRERRRTKRDPRERCQGAAARATPCVAGVPPISGTHRPQGRSMSIRKSPGHLVGAFCLDLTSVPNHLFASTAGAGVVRRRIRHGDRFIPRLGIRNRFRLIVCCGIRHGTRLTME